MDNLADLLKGLGIKSGRAGPPGPPKVLEGRDIPSIAKYIKSGKCKSIMLMVSGAGHSYRQTTNLGRTIWGSPDRSG